MGVTHLEPRDYRTMAWKNGQGVTTEVAVHPASGPFVWRISIADVGASGPFSDFSGYERTIMLLEGKGMALSFDQAPPRVIAARHVPFSFAGEWRTMCELLDGPVRDFNLMVDRRRAQGELKVIALSGAELTHACSGDTSLFHCLEGEVDADLAGQRFTLQRGDTLRLDGPMANDATVRLRALDQGAVLAAIEIHALRRAE